MEGKPLIVVDSVKGCSVKSALKSIDKFMLESEPFREANLSLIDRQTKAVMQEDIIEKLKIMKTHMINEERKPTSHSNRSKSVIEDAKVQAKIKPAGKSKTKMDSGDRTITNQKSTPEIKSTEPKTKLPKSKATTDNVSSKSQDTVKLLADGKKGASSENSSKKSKKAMPGDVVTDNTTTAVREKKRKLSPEAAEVEDVKIEEKSHKKRKKERKSSE